MPEQPAPEIDFAEPVEPTDAEVAAAAATEAKDAVREAAKKAAPRRGPGRPPGAKNKSNATREATTRATTTRTSSAAPKSTPAAIGSNGTADAAGRAERKRIRDERTARVNEVTRDMLKHKTSLVRAVGMATGIPAQYLVGVEGDEQGRPIIDHETQQPKEVLTHYGQALAPQDWQVKTCVEAYVRLEESEQGQRLLEAADRLMPYAMMVGALGALGMYTLTVMQASQAIRDMVAVEVAQAAQAAGVPPQTPGTPDGGVPG
ncbi:MAG TPA: hypothetical protein VMV41_00170 [Cellulomonadaceae bacterium]|nr:hypothetical protein [Cellulomonadaceae bacterium]